MTKHRDAFDWDSIPDLLSTPVHELQARLGLPRERINLARTRRRRALGMPVTRGWRIGRSVGIAEERARSVPRGTSCECCGDPATDRFRGRFVCGECLKGAGDAIDADLLSAASMTVAAAVIVERRWHVLG